MKFLRDKYGFSGIKQAKLFPIPVLSRWGSWRKSSVYLAEYVEDVAAYATTITGSKLPKSVKYFKKLKEHDIVTIKAEANFVSEYCSPVCDLLVKCEKSKDPMSHVLYSKVNELSKSFEPISNATDKDNTKSLLSVKMKDLVNKLPDDRQKTLLQRLKNVCVESCKLLSSLQENDTAKEFFQSSRILFHQSKLTASLSSETVIKAKKKISLLDTIPDDSFRVLHSVLADLVIENSKQAGNKSRDLVLQALMSMRQDHEKFVTACIQVMHIPVSNVDVERGFSAYGDILSPKRTNLTSTKVETMMCLYFNSNKICKQSDDDNENDNTEEGTDINSNAVYFDEDEDFAIDDDFDMDFD